MKDMMEKDTLSGGKRDDLTGKEEGMIGSKIPTLGRIIALADSFDAMTSARSYNEPKTFEAAICDICGNAGGQFDPDMVYTLAKVLCKERVVRNYGPNGEVEVVKVGGLIASEETFQATKEVYDYDYTNPLKLELDPSTGKTVISCWQRDYHPNYELLHEFSETCLRDRESFDKFAEKSKRLKGFQDKVFGLGRDKLKIEDLNVSPTFLQPLNDIKDKFKKYLPLNLRTYMDATDDDLNKVENETKEPLTSMLGRAKSLLTFYAAQHAFDKATKHPRSSK